MSVAFEFPKVWSEQTSEVVTGKDLNDNFAAVQDEFNVARMIRVETIEDLKAAIGATDLEIVYVEGYYEAGDGGGGFFRADTSDSTSTDNGGTLIVADDNTRWNRQYSGALNVKWFGAVSSSESTTGSITAASTSLTVDSAIDFIVGQGIHVVGAGEDDDSLATTVTGISGTTITLADAAETTVSSATVYHDELAAFDAALAAADDLDGGEIFVPRGLYSSHERIQLKTNTSLVGEPGWGSTLQLTAATCNGEFISIHGVDHTKVLHLVIQAVDGLLGDNGVGIFRHIDSCGTLEEDDPPTDVEVAHCLIHNFKGNVGSGGKGVTAQFGAKDVFIHHNLIQDCGVGFSCGAVVQDTNKMAVGILFTDNIIRNVENLGIFLTRTEVTTDPFGDVDVMDVTVARNTLIDCGSDTGKGAITGDRASGCKIIDNKVLGSCISGVRGIFFDCEFMGNTFDITATNWVDFTPMEDGGTVPGTQNTWANNVFSGTISGDGFTSDASTRIKRSVLLRTVVDQTGLTGSLFTIALDASNIFEMVDRDTAGIEFGIGSDVLNFEFTTSHLLTVHRGLSIGGGAPIFKHLSASKTWDPPSIAASGGVANTTVTVSGAQAGDPAIAGFTEPIPDGVILAAFATGDDLVKVILYNSTGAAIDLDSGTLRASVFQY